MQNESCKGIWRQAMEFSMLDVGLDRFWGNYLRGTYTRKDKDPFNGFFLLAHSLLFP